MNKEKYRKVLSDIAQKIFEEAAFALVDPPDEEAGEAGNDNPVSVSVDFKGPFSGKVCISSDEQMATMLAANMLGTEEDDPEAATRARDALKEIVNMVCGNFLPAIAGKEPEFKIEAPEEISKEQFSALAGASGEDTISEKIFVEGMMVELVYEERK